jgi:multidrug transporter EmrE-like cation transporter
MNAATLPLILLSVTLTAVAQLVLKRGMSASGMHEVLAAGWMPAALAVASNAWVMAGLALYFVGALIWLVVLNRVAVSFAYPFVGLGFVLTALLAWALLGEGLTAYRALGTLLVTLGVVLIARGA